MDDSFTKTKAIVDPYACGEDGCDCICHRLWSDVVAQSVPSRIPSRERLNVNHPSYSKDRPWPMPV
jgi:hypothetical protein